MPDDVPAAANRAVFLSYAREDTDAARRIADALNAFAVEVWFDQSELRSGDQWDGKIKKQIRDCALFLPIISRQTQARAEGYFRREWKMAVERTHDMSASVAFIVPVVIDETREAEADVPEEFMRYQWTRLERGTPSPQFVEQIKRLLAAPRTAPDAGRGLPTPLPGRAKIGAAGSGDPALQPSRAKRFPNWAVALVVVLLGLVAFLALRRVSPDPAETLKVAKETKPATPIPSSVPGSATPDLSAKASATLDPKSIAVLAFANLSADKDNEYFSDGLSENILDKLARVPGLRVMARTSSFSYKGKNVPVQQIAAELHVGTVIEGSVQRAGNTLRVVAQLINASDGMHVWSETFDREQSTAGIFAIQDEIAQKIAARLSPNSAPAQSSGVAVPTKNLAAYEAYLRGRDQQTKGLGGLQEALGFFERATELDPGFAVAWVQLARVHASSHYNGLGDEDREQALARAAIDQAQRLQPDLTDIHLALAAYRFYVETDLSSAIRELDLLARIRTEDSETLQLRGNIYLNLGRFSDSIEVCQQSVLLDPKNLFAWNLLGLSLGAMSRYPEALSAYERCEQINPLSGYQSNRAGTILRWKGDSKMALASFRDLPFEKMSTAGASAYINYYWMTGDHAGALKLIDRAGWSGALTQSEYLFSDLVKARVREAMDDSEGAHRDYLAALPQVERTRDAHPRSYRAYIPLARVYAGLGRNEEALSAARRCVELMPPSHDPRVAANTSLRVLVEVEARFGLFDEALDLVQQQIAAGRWKRNDLLFHPDFIHLRKDPRFRALAEQAPL